MVEQKGDQGDIPSQRLLDRARRITSHASISQ